MTNPYGRLGRPRVDLRACLGCMRMAAQDLIRRGYEDVSFHGPERTPEQN